MLLDTCRSNQIQKYIIFFLKVSNSFWHPDENHTKGATNSFPHIAASPEQRRGQEPTGTLYNKEQAEAAARLGP